MTIELKTTDFTPEDLAAIRDHYEADDVLLVEPGETGVLSGKETTDTPGVHVLTNRERGDGGPRPWWMYAGTFEDVLRQVGRLD